MLLEQQTSSRENQRWTGVLSPLLYSGYKEWDRVLQVICWLDVACILGREDRANTFSLWGRREGSLYCSIDTYNTGEGKMIQLWVLCSGIPRPSLVLSALSSLGQLTDHMFLIPKVRRPPGPYMQRKGPWRPKGSPFKGGSTRGLLRQNPSWLRDSYTKIHPPINMGGSWDMTNMDSEPGKS